jgi:hypothetical protein
VATESNRLFLLWAAKHKQAIELEEELAQADGSASPELVVRVSDAQGEALALLARAKEAFNAELAERGLVELESLRPSA